MEHDLDLLAKVLEDEDRLNGLEKEIDRQLIDSVKSTNGRTKQNAVLYVDVAQDLELIGDYCKDILERVQIKIEEKLLFSEEIVNEYIGLHRSIGKELEKLVDALTKDELCVLKDLSRGHKELDNLVDGYRKNQSRMMIEGLCSPMACNMYINMLDFTAEVYHHTKNIARNLAKIRS
jgi:phosphate:Na+ symporter